MKLYRLFISALAGIFLLGILVGRMTAPGLASEDAAEIESRLTPAGTASLNPKRAATPTRSESLFDAVPTNRFEEMARTAAASLDPVENEAMLTVLVSRWAKNDPRAAIAFAQELERDDFVYESYLQWAQRNPDEALSWLAQNEQNAGQQRYLATAVYKGMAKTNPLAAVGRLDQMSTGAQRDELMGIVIDEWANQDVYAAFDWLETIELTPAFSDIYSQVMGRYIEQDPMTAAALVSEMYPTEDKVNFASQVAVKLAEQDVDYALEWVNTLNDDSAKKYALQGIMDRWSKGEDAAAALDYVIGGPTDRDSMNLFTNVAMNVSYHEPDLLTEAFDRMSTTQQLISAQQLASVLSVEDPDRAMEWVQSLEPGDVRDAAIENTLRSYKKANVTGAFELSQSISDDTSRYKHMQEVLTIWVAVDQQAAEQALYRSSAVVSSDKEDLLNRVYRNLKPSDYVIPAKP